MLPLLITIQNVFFAAGERLKKDEKGATAVEYGLLIGLVAVVLVAAMALLKTPVETLVTDITAKMKVA